MINVESWHQGVKGCSASVMSNIPMRIGDLTRMFQ